MSDLKKKHADELMKSINNNSGQLVELLSSVMAVAYHMGIKHGLEIAEDEMQKREIARRFIGGGK